MPPGQQAHEVQPETVSLRPGGGTRRSRHNYPRRQDLKPGDLPIDTKYVVVIKASDDDQPDSDITKTLTVIVRSNPPGVSVTGGHGSLTDQYMHAYESTPLDLDL